MICSRRLQVTQTAKKSTLKTLESALLTLDPKTGEVRVEHQSLINSDGVLFDESSFYYFI